MHTVTTSDATMSDRPMGAFDCDHPPQERKKSIVDWGTRQSVIEALAVAVAGVGVGSRPALVSPSKGID